MDNLQFINKLKEKNINLTSKMIEQFERYFELIDQYNKVMDLTALSDKDEIYDRHFYNSLTIAFDNDFNDKSFCDVGAGAGFPSIPLKIIFPKMKLTILDPLNKRMNFLKIVVNELNLSDVNFVIKRAEDAKELKESFDIVSARAVARLNILVELICQLPKVNGLFIAMKGASGDDELKEANNALKETNLKLIKKDIINPSINFFFLKEKSVNNKYPRNYGQIKKKPL